MFRGFSAVFPCFSRVFTGVERGKKSLVFGGGFPWFLPKHQGMEDQGRAQTKKRKGRKRKRAPKGAKELKCPSAFA